MFLPQTPVITPIIDPQVLYRHTFCFSQRCYYCTFFFLINIIFTLDFVICTKSKPSTYYYYYLFHSPLQHCSSDITPPGGGRQYVTKLAGKIPTRPSSRCPSHQSYCESVLVMTVMRSPGAMLRSPGC